MSSSAALSTGLCLTVARKEAGKDVLTLPALLPWP